MSTSSVEVANEIRALASPRRISVMEAPVSFLAKVPIGESRTGAGYGIKVLLNLLWFIHAAGASEVLAMASKLGLDLRVLQQALCSSPSQSNFLQYDINSVFEQGNYDDGFTIDLVCKDIQLGLGLGEKTGIDIPVSRIVEELHQRALQTYGPKSGEMSVVKLYEDAAGAPFRP